jgi:hypothetical protein
MANFDPRSVDGLDIPQSELLIPRGRTVADLLTNEYGESPCYVQGLIYEGLWFLAGLPKVGKSFIVTQLLQGLATGGKFMGRQCRKSRVLYCALEDSERRLKNRMSVLNWAGAGDRITVWLAADWQQYIERLDGLGVQRLADAITAGGFDVVIIDTLSRAMAGQGSDQMKVDDVVAALAPLQAIATASDISIGVLDHQAKNGKGNSDVEDVYGSIGKTGVADTVCVLRKDQQSGEVHLTATGRDLMGRQDLQIKRESNGMWALVADWTASPFKTSIERMTLKAIADAGDDGINTRSLRQTVGGQGKDVDEAARQLKIRKLIDTRPGDKNSILHVLTDAGREAVGQVMHD